MQKIIENVTEYNYIINIKLLKYPTITIIWNEIIQDKIIKMVIIH